MEGWGELGRMRWVYTVRHGTAVRGNKHTFRGTLKSQGRDGKEINFSQTHMLNKGRHYTNPCVFKHTLRSGEG